VRGAGFTQVRVRDLGGAASIEVEPALVGRLAEPAVIRGLERTLLSLGYSSVSVDPAGYRPGHMNLGGTGLV
jgi:uncharacterized protein